MPLLRTNIDYFPSWNQQGMGRYRGLGRYVAAVRGMGQCDYEGDPTCGGDDSGGTTGIAVSPLPDLPVQGVNVGTIANLPNLPTATTPAAPTATTAAPSTSSLASLLQGLASGAVAATQIYKSTQSPSLIAGTNVLYNPATGTYYNATTGQVVSPSGISTGSVVSSSAIPILLVIAAAIGGVMLIEGMHH